MEKKKKENNINKSRERLQSDLKQLVFLISLKSLQLYVESLWDIGSLVFCKWSLKWNY